MGLRINELDRLLALLGHRDLPQRVITIGRMDVFVGLPAIKALCAAHQLRFTDMKDIQANPPRVFLDQVLRWIGIQVVDSIDYSDFEGATVIHDLSQPLPSNGKTYDLVYESGTLEHIFNFPVALENVLNLCSIGGRVLLNTPCNNQAGHGFYQFSPELFFSAFRDSKIFTLEAVEVYEDFDNSPRYRVLDPKLMRRRVEVRSILPVNMTVVLRRFSATTGSHVLSADKVLQTDYVYAWDKAVQTPTALSARAETYSSGQQQRRALLLKVDQLLGGLVRWLISTRRRLLYLGSRRTDLQVINRIQSD